MQNVTIVFGSHIGMLLIGILTQSFLARLLGPEDRGAYAVAFLFATLMALIFAVGLDTAGRYFVASKKLTCSQGVVNTFVNATIGSVLGILVGLVVMHLPLTFFAKAPRSAFALAIVLIPVMMLRLALSGILTAVQEFTLSAVLNIAGALLTLVLTLLFVGVFQWGVHGAVLVVASTWTLVILASLKIFRSRYDLKWHAPALHDLLAMARFGLRYYVGKLFNQVNFQIGTIILAFFADQKQIAFFSVAAVLATRVMLIPDSVTAVLLPKVAADQEGRGELVALMSRVCAVVCGIALLVLAVAAHPIVMLLYGSAYEAAAVLIQIISIGVFVRCASKVFVPYLVGRNHPGIASVAVAAGMITNIATLWFLLPRIGLPGAAVAMTASFCVSSAFLVWSFVRISRIPLRNIWRFRRHDFSTLLGRGGVSTLKKTPEEVDHTPSEGRL